MAKGEKELMTVSLILVVYNYVVINFTMSVPSIIKDALATAKQTIETELAKTLQNIYKLTGIYVLCLLK